MQKRTQVIITFLALVVLISFLYIATDIFSKVTGYFGGEGEKDRLIKCLTGNSAEFYTSISCADCERQQKLFGESFKLISVVDCGNNMELCPNLQSIPAWYINQNIYYGYKNLTELKSISGCG